MPSCPWSPFCPLWLCFFFFTDTAPTEIYTLSLHDALPIWRYLLVKAVAEFLLALVLTVLALPVILVSTRARDRKSTRLNSSHRCISYAVFCLKKKKNRLPSKHTTITLVRRCRP